MAGHSKWANIQHRKNRQDARRGKLFSKLIREITVAARLSGEEPAANPRLRAAIDNALAANMARDTIERAVKRGGGGGESDSLEEVRYEGYGPGGVAVMVDCMTDNRNRTVAEVRHVLSKCGGKLGTDGSVAWMFTKVGQISYASDTDEDKLMEAALEAGAEDVINNADGSYDVLASVDDFVDVKAALTGQGLTPEAAGITMHANTTSTLDPANAAALLRLLERLDDLDDVQQVYVNTDVPAELLA